MVSITASSRPHGEGVARAVRDTQQVLQDRKARAFARAQAHSRHVRLLRRLLPWSVLLGVGGLVIAPYLNPFRTVEGLGLGPVSLSGSKVTMENPKLTGYRKDGKPYELVARSATQDVRRPNQIELFEMDARVQQNDGWVRLQAATGQYDSQREQMQLKGGVKVRTEAGHDMQLRTADIDFKAGTVQSQEPVTVRANNTTIDADTLDVIDNGKTITFKGRVKAVVLPDENTPSLAPGPGRTP